ARCPNTKLVISGYSQGAQVVGDIIGGGNGTFFQGCTTTPTPALDVNSALGKQIVAVTVFGNTRHTANQPYNQFSGAPDNGIFPRPDYQLANLATWTSKFHDYCVAEDPICAGGDVVADHLNYFDLYSDTAAAWIKSQIASDDVVVSSTIVSPSSTFTSVATSGKAVPTTYAYTNNTATTNPALTAASSASLSSIQSSVLAIPTVAPESAVTVTVNCASVDTSAIASYTSAWASTATGTQNVGATPTGGSISATTGSATSGAAGSKSSSAANGTHTLMPYTGAASSISGAVSGSLAVVLLGAFALVL
ncbi:alpha/beta-hydrolase, partial [Aureobasidium melanogenum]